MKKGYFIKKKEFENLYNLSKELHAYNSLIEMYCKAYENTDDFYKIIPVITSAVKKSDKLHALFINMA